MQKINIEEKFGLFSDHWNPRIIASLNGQDVKIARIEGEFVWHDHKDEDELFYVIKGNIKIELRDQVIELKAGEMFVVPKGVEHRPVAGAEAWILLFEPAETKHTGEVADERTVSTYEKI